jgi:hypothetical protein
VPTAGVLLRVSARPVVAQPPSGVARPVGRPDDYDGFRRRELPRLLPLSFLTDPRTYLRLWLGHVQCRRILRPGRVFVSAAFQRICVMGAANVGQLRAATFQSCIEQIQVFSCGLHRPW